MSNESASQVEAEAKDARHVTLTLPEARARDASICPSKSTGCPSGRRNSSRRMAEHDARCARGNRPVGVRGKNKAQLQGKASPAKARSIPHRFRLLAKNAYWPIRCGAFGPGVNGNAGAAVKPLRPCDSVGRHAGTGRIVSAVAMKDIASCFGRYVA